MSDYSLRCFVYLLVLSVISSPVFSQTPSMAVDRFLTAYNSQQFDVAASCFHISENLSKSERDDEIDGLTASFRILFDEFGKVSVVNRSENTDAPSVKLIDIDIFSMSAEYWDKRQGFQIERFACDFENAGVGQLESMLYRENGKTLLRSVNFAVPESANNAQMLVTRIGQKLHKFYDDRSLRSNALSGQVRLSILITSTRKAALAAKDMLQNGMLFAEVIKKYSVERSANPTGDMGFVFPEDILPELQPAATNLAIGEISNVLPLNERYALLQKTDEK